MANFIVRHRTKGVARIEIRGERFTVAFHKCNGIPGRYKSEHWGSVRQDLLDEGCTIECRSWITPQIFVHPNDDSDVGGYVCHACLNWNYHSEEEHFAYGAIPEKAIKAFWQLWNRRCDELNLPSDVVVLARPRYFVRLHS